MPELPEVEYVARQLTTTLVGRRILSVEVCWARSVQGMLPEEFAARLADRAVLAIARRGKYLLIALDGGETLIVHRRMSGNLIFADHIDEDPYVRVALKLDDGHYLLYSDPRKFGRLALVASDGVEQALPSLGPEPLDANFTPDVLAARLAGTRRPLKAVLLDQSVIAGLGNIYADEALFRARIHPLRTGASLSRDEIQRLHAGIQDALRTGIENGGTTFGRHRDVHNEAGANLAHLEVYRRTGQPCLRCGTPIARITVLQRGTHYCPHCQPLE